MQAEYKNTLHENYAYFGYGLFNQRARQHYQCTLTFYQLSSDGIIGFYFILMFADCMVRVHK
jgi:hypothetical protein